MLHDLKLYLTACYACSLEISQYHAGKTGPSPQYGSYVSRIFPEYFNVSISRTTFPYYGFGQNYGNWIFQIFYTIFRIYFHTMYEVQFFQCHWTIKPDIQTARKASKVEFSYSHNCTLANVAVFHSVCQV